MEEKNYVNKDAREYADHIIESHQDKEQYTKDELYSYVYWAFYNGQVTQHKQDIAKLLKL